MTTKTLHYTRKLVFDAIGGLAVATFFHIIVLLLNCCVVI